MKMGSKNGILVFWRDKLLGVMVSELVCNVLAAWICH